MTSSGSDLVFDLSRTVREVRMSDDETESGLGRLAGGEKPRFITLFALKVERMAPLTTRH
jgi:hypothetical protein